jgi:Flp pilus assembly protein TadG
MWSTRRGRERGHAMLEFAFIAPVVVLIFCGVVDFSRFLYYDQAVVGAARSGTEMAINHCVSHSSCGITDSPVGDDFVVQAVYCSAMPQVQLHPQASTCASCLTVNCSAATPICDTSCLANICVQDICTNPLAASRTNGVQVSVAVGYSFKPFTPLLSMFFPDKQCWSGDSLTNHHTICATSTGAVY